MVYNCVQDNFSNHCKPKYQRAILKPIKGIKNKDVDFNFWSVQHNTFFISGTKQELKERKDALVKNN